MRRGKTWNKERRGQYGGCESRSSARFNREMLFLPEKLSVEAAVYVRKSKILAIGVASRSRSRSRVFSITRDAAKISMVRKLTTFAERSVHSAAVESHVVARARHVEPEKPLSSHRRSSLKFKDRSSKIARRCHRRRIARLAKRCQIIKSKKKI